MTLEFKPLYFGDKLHRINSRGVIGVVTLWSKPEYVMERFREADPELLDPEKSPIAVFGTLYGNGLREMLRNLLYNPQIQEILICGHDRSGSAKELLRFFRKDSLEPEASPLVRYKNPAGVNRISTCRIRDTHRLIDDLVKPTDFPFFREGRPLIVLMRTNDPTDEEVIPEIRRYLGGRISRWNVTEEMRKKIPLPELEVQYFPSNPLAHQIQAETLLEAWRELLFLLSRFGWRVTLPKGDRLELLNVKVVVQHPAKTGRDQIRGAGLDYAKFHGYQEDFLSGELRPDESYNYGHRLRRYFGMDAIEVCAARLSEDPEDRKSYFTLWDNARDLTAPEGRPCLVSIFFRKVEDKLSLTATFRTHNALDAWPLNFYGLAELQWQVAKRANIPPGPITVFSHSISIDPRELDRALTVVGQRRWKMHLDPMGYFRVTLDGKEILVEHRFEDVTLKEYRGRTAMALQHQIARDLAVSDINHAIYLGRQLAKAEAALKEGREFVQD
jgi:thymidylate synthase